ncbi:pentatricopeptide repeat-containing protein At5g66520-like [Telopea speciosissima]|uniref:pentatricopeptide repeat-containing protein At5g66520-like n=1 Tax=Telopea speciosissima TaxID=54955 RepID=UPI001CC4D9BD|nr:pentatricopeptide repeat-containing protein At5g66520-like [Telopea speciosissima]
MITVGLVRYIYITSRILALYAVSEFGDLSCAQSIFDRIPMPTIFNWNTIIKGYSKSPEPKKGLSIYTRMRSEGVQPNMHTFPVLIKACVNLSSLAQVHGQIVKFRFDPDVYVVSSLLNVYSKYGAIDLARQVFDETPNRNVVCWTSLISGHCGDGRMGEARELFDRMPERNDVAWSAMISGYVQNDFFNEAIELFHELKVCSNVKPNRSLLVSILNACAGVGAFTEGKWVHSYIDRNGFEYGLELGTALIDFYAKCGCIESSIEVLHKMPCKDVMAWSAMFVGLAINGYNDLVFKLFEEMEGSGTKPNAVTFIGILTACNHGGLVDEGRRFFKMMSKVYGISPIIEHYGCMVDLLARAGQIKEAEQLISGMPMEPDGIIWGALFSGCLMHGHVELGECVGKRLIELEPHHHGRYVLLANMYATMGRWEDVVRLRRMMKDRGVTTYTGWSFIDINGVVHKFQVDDRSHSQSRAIYELLNLLNTELITL